MTTDSGAENPPDERGIDLAMMAYIGAIMSGEPQERAIRNASAMLKMFGFTKATKP